MNLTDSFYDDVIVVRVDGELDRATATCFSEYVGAQLSLGLRRFLVDLEGCSLICKGLPREEDLKALDELAVAIAERHKERQFA